MHLSRLWRRADRAFRLSHSSDADQEWGLPEVLAANSRSLELTCSTCLRVSGRSPELSMTKSANFTFSSKGIWERIRASISSSDKPERVRNRCFWISGVQV